MRLKLDPWLSKWIKDLTVHFKMVKLTQEKIGSTLDHRDIGNNFMSRTPKVKQLRENIDKWDYMKLKHFCTAKCIVTRLER
jgi:hypothetical protein